MAIEKIYTSTETSTDLAIQDIMAQVMLELFGVSWDISKTGTWLDFGKPNLQCRGSYGAPWNYTIDLYNMPTGTSNSFTFAVTGTSGAYYSEKVVVSTGTTVALKIPLYTDSLSFTYKSGALVIYDYIRGHEVKPSALSQGEHTDMVLSTGKVAISPIYSSESIYAGCFSSNLSSNYSNGLYYLGGTLVYNYGGVLMVM